MTIPSELKHIRPHIRERLEALQKKGGQTIMGVPVNGAQLAAKILSPLSLIPVVQHFGLNANSMTIASFFYPTLKQVSLHRNPERQRKTSGADESGYRRN